MSQKEETKQDDGLGWWIFFTVVILILAVYGAWSATLAIFDLGKPNSLKNDKTYQLAYKELMKRDKELTDLIDDLKKFKTEDLKQRKQRLLEDHLRISDETPNTIEEKKINQKEETVHAAKQYKDLSKGEQFLLGVILTLIAYGTFSAIQAICDFFKLRSLKNKKIDEEIKLLKQELDSLKQNLEEKIIVWKNKI